MIYYFSQKKIKQKNKHKMRINGKETIQNLIINDILYQT